MTSTKIAALAICLLSFALPIHTMQRNAAKLAWRTARQFSTSTKEAAKEVPVPKLVPVKKRSLRPGIKTFTFLSGTASGYILAQHGPRMKKSQTCDAAIREFIRAQQEFENKVSKPVKSFVAGLFVESDSTEVLAVDTEPCHEDNSQDGATDQSTANDREKNPLASELAQHKPTDNSSLDENNAAPCTGEIECTAPPQPKGLENNDS